ncbi:hypothetical protein [Vogesella sp. LIG4]|uniref:hypothetical protein n=1 Tax=Vogesella sp. LIG4 TaxID=1192162 RepID=UPI00081FD3EE|nr:hypothetical protein [Vogesella sp. LIG4]SCK24017.1 hypothetical protein PSELUDRAFT_2814 [Vogesella sp. LIG4]
MNRYCIWFVTADDTATRRAEVSLAGTLHSNQVLEEIELRLADELRLPRIMITNWQRFEDR